MCNVNQFSRLRIKQEINETQEEISSEEYPKGYLEKIVDFDLPEVKAQFGEENDRSGLRYYQAVKRNNRNKRWNTLINFLENSSINYKQVRNSHVIVQTSIGDSLIVYPKASKYSFEGRKTKYPYYGYKKLLKRYGVIDKKGKPLPPQKNEKDKRKEDLVKFCLKNGILFGNPEDEYKFQISSEEDEIIIYTKSSTWKSEEFEFQDYKNLVDIFKNFPEFRIDDD